MYCKNCGQLIKEGQAYCNNCGSPVVTVGSNKPKKDNKKWFIILGGSDTSNFNSCISSNI